MFSWWMRSHWGVSWWFTQLFRCPVNPWRLRNTDLYNIRLGWHVIKLRYCLQHCELLTIAKYTVILWEVYNTSETTQYYSETTDWLSLTVFPKQVISEMLKLKISLMHPLYTASKYSFWKTKRLKVYPLATQNL